MRVLFMIDSTHSREINGKIVAERFITHWCKAIVAGKGAEFEAGWGLAEEFETPKKKPRRRY